MVQGREQLPRVQLHVKEIPLTGQLVDDFVERLVDIREDQRVFGFVRLNFELFISHHSI